MERLLRIGEVAKLLDINPMTLYQMVGNDEIPHIRMGKHGRTIRFEPLVIDQWLAEKKRG